MASSNEGFLTDKQREVLKIAVENAEGLSSSPRSPSFMLNDSNFKGPTAGGRGPTAGNAVRHVRRSHSGKLVRVKKDGAGGKGTWGKLLDTDADTHTDKNDPNYDSDEEPYELVGASVSTPLYDYKKFIISIIEEYFSSGDVDQAASDLRDLQSDEYHHHFVKKLVSMAMDRHDKEKEMSTVLLSALYADVITSDHISQGFLMLLESADDLALDIVDAVEVLAIFIARAVVDDILPPAFLRKAKEKLPESSKGFQTVLMADKSYLSVPHHAEIIERKWGGSTHITVEEVKKKITDLLREYTQNGDIVEACRCIRDLGLSFFHHEVVKRAIILSMEIPSTEPLIFKLLKEAADEGLISSSQMAKGFLRVSESLDDLSLDIPSAKSLFQLLVPRAVSEGWLEPTDSDKKLRQYKEEASVIIQEYFLSDDIPELIRSLVDMSAPGNYPIFLKKLVTLALDKRNREKEMTSVLITALRSELFSTEDMINGFVMILEDSDDTALDILDASDEIAFFLARAVIDDSLVPLDLVEMSSRVKSGSRGSEILHMAKTLVSSRHAGERLLRCWGGGSGWAVEDTKDKIARLLEVVAEDGSGGDVGEACQCIRDLGMPFFGHEVVKKALVMAMEKKTEMILALLEECFNEGLITINQMTKGFSRLRDSLEDLALDVPDARDKFLTFKVVAEDKGWLFPWLA